MFVHGETLTPLFQTISDDTALHLLIASRTSVVKSNLEVWVYDPLPLPPFRSLTAIDIDVNKSHIYFSDTVLKKIFRTDINGTNLTEVCIMAKLALFVSLIGVVK